MALRRSTLAERIRSSLFFEPMAFVIGSVALGLLGLRVDRSLLANDTDLPFNLTSTVDSSRAVLSTVAGATITVAGIAFSISLLIIQLASSQYSPRVVPGLFRDPFNKRVMGVVVGTFTYCLVVLRAVRTKIEDDGTPVIPSASVAVAVILGVVSILAIVAFIDHNAHAMDVSRILHEVTEQALHVVRKQWHERGSEPEGAEPPPSDPPVDVLVVPFREHGWLQRVEREALARAGDPGSTIRLESSVGRYVVAGTPLCTIWPAPEDRDAACSKATRSVGIGETRTSPQDVGYGLRQLADVALKALSPGINDPTTAQDAMFHLGSVLRELCVRRPPHSRLAMEGERTIILTEEPTHAELIDLAFDEVRLASASMPTFSIYLLELIRLLLTSLDQHDVADCGDALRRQARLIREGVEASTELLEVDRRRVIAAYADRFGRMDRSG